MRFFTKFPYTNLNNLNLDWIIERIRNIEEFLSGVSDSIEAAQNAADAAQTAADAAQEAADTAQEAADTAQEAADTAQATIDKEILYYENVAVVPATNAQIMRIPATGTDGRITTNSVVLECSIENRLAVKPRINYISYGGYIVFNGTATSATVAKIAIGNKNN